MKKYFLTYLTFSFTTVFSSAQPGNYDSSFNPQPGTNGQVWSVAVQDDGKILIGGTFTSYNGTPVNNIVRSNADGSIDNTFNPGGSGTNFTVWWITLQTDGKILIGGYFSSYNGIPGIRIARLNADGTIDSSFNTGSGANSQVYVIAMQQDGKILVGGNFTIFNGVGANRLVRLNSDGSVDTGFNTQVGANDHIRAISVQSDGKIIVAGQFTLYNGVARNCIVRLEQDGTLDSGFDSSSGFNGTVITTAIQPDGKILVGGMFTLYNGIAQNYIARLNDDASIDNTFSSSGANDQIRTFAIQSDNKIVVGGYFTSMNGVVKNYLARLNIDGTLDTEFDTGTGANGYVYSSIVQTNQRIMIAGEFTSYNGSSMYRVARICSCGTNQPASITGNTSVCQNSMQTYSIDPVTGADSYTWILPTGWVGNSDSTSINVMPGSEGGVISVVANSNICCSSAQKTLDVEQAEIPVPSICLVTVDTLSTHTIIYWDKPVTTVIDSFYLYKEVTTNNYIKIAAISYDSLNEYHDFEANPNSISFNYKLSILDTCGNESQKSTYHRTIHLQNLGNGNLLWSLYEIENASNPVIFYRVYRDDFGSGNFQPINLSIPGNNSSYTDILFGSFPDAKYFVDVNWDISCTTFKSTLSTSRSNLRGNNETGFEEIADNIRIYPNPANEIITIEFMTTYGCIMNLELINVLGELVYAETFSIKGNTKKQVEVKNFTKGIYVLQVSSDNISGSQKIIIQ